jgi:ketosteroid isomerase-like protein
MRTKQLLSLTILNLMALFSGGLMADGENADPNRLSNLEIVENVYASFASGDMDGSLQNMDEDIVWLHPAEGSGIPFAGRFEGRDGVRRFFEIADQSIEVLDQQVHDLVASGDKVVALGYEHMRVRDNGREYKSNWAHIYSFQNGKIIRFEEFIDTAEVAAAFNYSSQE